VGDEGATSSRVSLAELPAGVTRPFEVYVNGVLQREGADFRVEGRTLVFSRLLEREGRLGTWKWLRMLLGIAGSYGRNDSVDVLYAREGRRAVATGLPVRRDG
jgi:hypothetical protein